MDNNSSHPNRVHPRPKGSRKDGGKERGCALTLPAVGHCTLPQAAGLPRLGSKPLWPVSLLQRPAPPSPIRRPADPAQHWMAAASGSCNPAPVRIPGCPSRLSLEPGGRLGSILHGGPARRPRPPAPSVLPSLRPRLCSVCFYFFRTQTPKGPRFVLGRGMSAGGGGALCAQGTRGLVAGEGRLLTARPPSSSGTLQVGRGRGGQAPSAHRGLCQGLSVREEVRPGQGSGHAERCRDVNG